MLEEKLLLYNIPYRIFGGINFYQRKEVKDLLSYLKVINNGSDDLAVKRIINVPKRGIGLTTLDKVNQYAQTYNMNFLDALFEVEHIPELKRAAEKIKGFTDLIQGFRDRLKSISLSQLFQDILDQTGYRRELEQEKTEEAMARIDNIDELMNKIVNYEDNAENPTLDELLEEIALVADIDNLEDERSCVVLMTLHSAKGLEFPHVFISGMEDGLFPGMMSVLADDPTEMEEERRLCYVGITRAQESLHLSSARRRMVRGESHFSKVSRFVQEIPKDLMDFGKPGQLGATKSSPINGTAGGNTFASPRKASAFTTPYQSKPIPMNSAVTIEYAVGDTVRHIKFGQGVVTEIRPGGRDYEVTVDFVKVGVKKMFASFAKLKKL